KLVLCRRKSLLGRLAVPTQCLNVILTDALTKSIHEAKTALCPRVTLVGGLAIPGYGLRIVLADAITVLISDAKTGLCRCISSLGSFSVIINRSLEPFRFIVSATELKNQPNVI